EVEHVKLAAGFEDAPHRTKCRTVFVRLEMMEHERRENAIEPRLGIRKLVSKSLIELDGDRCSRGLASGAGESLGIGVDANHCDIRVKLLGQGGQSARAAADVKTAMTKSQRPLFQQSPPGRITA